MVAEPGATEAGAVDPVATAFAQLVALPDETHAAIVADLSEPQRRELASRWSAWALPGQLAPPGDWLVWMIRAGRGFGKTRAGAEWVSALARTRPDARIALVGAIADDVRRVMIEGESGLLSVARDDERPVWKRSSGEVTFDSGAIAQVFSAETPDKLRGPQHHAAWCDELAKWRRGAETWDNLMLGMRLGERPRVMVTTTPQPSALMRRIMALPGLVETRGRTRDNPHLPMSFVAAMEAQYGATRIGRQELDGELIEDLAGALWSRAALDACRLAEAPELVRVVIGVDPPAGSATGRGDACGIVAVGLGRDDLGYVIEDASVQATSPEGWARAVAACAARHDADRVVAEKNNGADMVRSVLNAADTRLPIQLVHATRGKVARAEPVAMLYEARRVKHIGAFRALEDEMCGLVMGRAYRGPGRSPDRADALIWALHELMLTRRGKAQARVL